jgi:DoxX-like family
MTDTQPKWMTWSGRVMSALPVLMMLLSGAMKVSHARPVLEGFGKFGFPEATLTPIGLLEVACAIVYLIPRTRVLGAILITGYFGGAVATHTRILDPSGVGPFLLGVFAWGGLFLRDARIRGLIPVQRS